MLAAICETQSQVQSLEEIAVMVTEQCQRQGRGQKPVRIVRLLSQRSSVKWPSFLEELSTKGGSMLRNLYSVFTLHSFQNVRLGVSRLLKGYPIQCLTCKDVYSHPPGSAGKWKKINSLKMFLFKACNGILTNAERKYTLPGLRADFACVTCGLCQKNKERLC